MELESLPVASLVPYARNARTHSAAQVAQIAGSIKEFGFTNPVLIDAEDGIIAGHGRVLAARQLNLAQVPCIRLGHLSEAQRRAYVLVDNKLALNAGWDAQMLASEILELKDLNFDLDLTGFSSEEIGALLARAGTQGLTDPDAVPEPPETPIACVGDVWLLGRHRLVCGDCTQADIVEKALNGDKADCVFTSPPYGVGVDYGEGYEDTLANLRAMLPLLASSWRRVLNPGGFAVINFGDIVSAKAGAGTDEPCEYPMAIEYWPPFRKEGYYLWSRRVWCKPNARVHSPWAMQTNRAASDWENVWTWKVPGKALIQRVNGDYQSANGWFDTSSEHGVDVGKKTHGAGMAVALPLRMISLHCRPGKIVFEPFSGSGTTIIAAEMTGRTCHAIELNPTYVDIAVKRWEQFTGETATRQ